MKSQMSAGFQEQSTILTGCGKSKVCKPQPLEFLRSSENIDTSY